MLVRFKAFESQLSTRQKILQKAADFASQVGRERLISITHSEDRDDEVVTIWYWDEPREGKPAAAPSLQSVTETTSNISLNESTIPNQAPAGQPVKL